MIATELKSLQNEEELTMLHAVLFVVCLQLAYCASQPGEIQQPPGKRDECFYSTLCGSNDGYSLKVFFSISF